MRGVDRETVSTEKSYYVQRYEELRACMLDTEAELIEAWGLNVLIRYGMARWMQTWDECLISALEVSSARRDDPVLIPGTWEREVTMRLSNRAIELQEQTV